MRLFVAATVFALASVLATAADEKKPADPVTKDEPKKDEPKKEEPKKEEPKVKDAVAELKLGDAKLKENENGKASAPTVIKTDDDLKKVVGEDAAKAMKVDFKKSYLLLFQWSGSGGDKLSAATEAKDGKAVVTFSVKPGATFDLRQHAHLYEVFGTDTEWKFAAAKPADPVKKEEPKKEEPKKEEPKKEEPKKEEPKPEFKGELRVVDTRGAKLAEKKDGKPGEPMVIKTDDELTKAVGEEAAKALKIDFKKEYLALFQWNGPIGDTLTHATEKKDGKMTVTTTLATGAGDKVNHVALVALPVGAEWKFGK